MATVINMFNDDDDAEGLPQEESLDVEEPSVQKRVPRDYAKQGARPPATTRGRERMVEEVPGTPEPEPVYQLLSVFGDRGRVQVALSADGQRVEQWRAPTGEELKILERSGRLVKGGIGEVQDAAPVAVAPVPVPPTPSILPKLLIGGAVVAGIGAALYFYKQSKEMDDPDNVEELD